MRLLIIVVLSLALILIFGQSFLPDTQPNVDDSNRWIMSCMPIEAGKFQACYGPGWPDYGPKTTGYQLYRVAVLRGDSGFPSTALFRKDFAAKDVDPLLLSVHSTPSVRYDEHTKTVFFNVGKSVTAFTLNVAKPVKGDGGG